MRWYCRASQILLILAVMTFALAAPVLVQEKRRAPEDVINALRKRSDEEDLHILWDPSGPLTYFKYFWRTVQEMREEAELPDEAEAFEQWVPVHPPNAAEEHAQGAHVLPPVLAGVHVPPQGAVDPDRELMELDDEALSATSKSGYSNSPPPSPKAGNVDFSPPGPEAEEWHTPPSSPAELDPERESTNSNSPSEESQSGNLKAADYGSKGEAKVSRRISGNANPR